MTEERTAGLGRVGLDATMADIAAIAGVTKMTVSRVLRHPERVNRDTRDRILQIMDSVGYIRNRIAGSLTVGKSGLVGAIVPTLRHSLFADTIEGMTDVLAEAGIHLIVANSRYRTDVEEGQIRAMLERRPDAIVLTGLTHSTEGRQLLNAAGIPVMELWESADEPIDMAVGFSNWHAAHAMTLALVGSGYRAIVFVNGPSETNERARHRAEGYVAALNDAGLKPLPIEVVDDVGAIRPETGAKVLGKILKARPDVDAIFFTTDVFAVGAILECNARGILVPDRLGIAGFHDLEMGQLVSPTLTSVHVPATEIGRLSAGMILARLAGEPVEQHRRDLPFKIVRRKSTREPP